MNEPTTTPWGGVEDAVNEESGLTAAPAAVTTDAVQADAVDTTPTTVSQLPQGTVMQGTQSGIGPQHVMVGGDGKGPKVPMIIAAVLIGFGLLGFVIGAIAGASVEDTINGLSTAEYTTVIGESGTLVHDDEDGAGEEGWYLLIPGDPEADENGNDIIDACEGITFTITDADGNDVGERVARISCDTTGNERGSNAYEPYFDIEDHVIVARICYTIPTETEAEHRCEIGESFTVSNNAGVNMSVVDLDAMYIPFLGEIIGVGILSGGSFFAGCCSLCGGVIFLIVGLTRVGGGKKTQQVQFQIH